MQLMRARRYCGLVQDINALEPQMLELTDMQLKAKTCAKGWVKS